MDELKLIENPLESLSLTVPFSSKDWGIEKRDAWVYGIICGWTDNCFSEFERKFGWNKETFERLKRLHSRFEEMRRAAPASELLTCEGCAFKKDYGKCAACDYCIRHEGYKDRYYAHKPE